MMAEIQIDLEIVTQSGAAVGRVAGTLMLAAIPAANQAVSFLFPINGNEICASPRLLDRVKVDQLILSPQPTIGGGGGVLVLLEKVVASDAAEAVRIGEYLQNGFGLKFEEW